MKWPSRKIDRKSTLNWVDHRTDVYDKNVLFISLQRKITRVINTLKDFKNCRLIAPQGQPLSHLNDITIRAPLAELTNFRTRTLFWAMSAVRYQFHMHNGLKEVVHLTLINRRLRKKMKNRYMVSGLQWISWVIIMLPQKYKTKNTVETNDWKWNFK